jgi:SAM-dependent methyltransferase
MTVTDLVFLKNQLEKLSIDPMHDQAHSSLSEFLYLINQYSPFDNEKFETQLSNVTNAFNSFDNEISILKEKLKEEITELGNQLFKESHTIWKNMIHWENHDDPITLFKIRDGYEPNKELHRSRVKLHVDWKYPAIVIRPGTNQFIEDMVGFDPLYMLDIRYELLQPALGKFNNLYQSRLRTHVVSENLTDNILHNMPNDQFGFCLAYDYLNYRPIEIIEKYLIEVYHKLKPGGTFILTFNDCDKANAVKLVEKNERPYTPGSLIKSLAISIGYEIIFTDTTDEASTWLELRKPGTLTSLRGGQTLARILPK